MQTRTSPTTTRGALQVQTPVKGASHEESDALLDAYECELVQVCIAFDTQPANQWC
jgi:hypothetical protein